MWLCGLCKTDILLISPGGTGANTSDDFWVQKKQSWHLSSWQTESVSETGTHDSILWFQCEFAKTYL